MVWLWTLSPSNYCISMNVIFWYFVGKKNQNWCMKDSNDSCSNATGETTWYQNSCREISYWYESICCIKGCRLISTWIFLTATMEVIVAGTNLWERGLRHYLFWIFIWHIITGCSQKRRKYGLGETSNLFILNCAEKYIGCSKKVFYNWHHSVHNMNSF